MHAVHIRNFVYHRVLCGSSIWPSSTTRTRRHTKNVMESTPLPRTMLARAWTVHACI